MTLLKSLRKDECSHDCIGVKYIYAVNIIDYLNSILLESYCCTVSSQRTALFVTYGKVMKT